MDGSNGICAAVCPAPKQAREWLMEHPETWGRKHVVDLRLTLPKLPGCRRKYMTIVVGNDRRSQVRRDRERAVRPVGTRGNVLFFTAVGVIVGAVWLLGWWIGG